MTWQRFVLLPLLASRDAAAAPLVPHLPLRGRIATGALDAAIDWLCLTHDVTGRHGSSKGFSLLFGWSPPFPETTGYMIGTLLEYARRTGRDDVAARAREMGDWEIEVQNSDGGVIEGLLTGEPKPSTVFNTGMVIHGWLDLGESHHIDAAVRAGNFLVEHQDADGAWRGDVEYYRIPHTYNSRVAWALLRLRDATGTEAFAETARGHLEWVLRQQRANGWFDACFFKPGMLPSTHSIAYTLRGLVESGALTGDSRFVDAARLTTEELMRKLEVLRRLPATFDSDWRSPARYECVTGTAQLGLVWLRLYQVTDDARYLNAGLKAVELAAARQMRLPWRPIHGAVPGSYPIYGRYAPLQFPNWATKFLVDALMLRDDVLARLG